MTPEEKAKELLNQFMKPVDDSYKYPMCFDTAKQCTLIAVNKMILENQSIMAMLKVHGNGRNRLPIQIRLTELSELKEAVNNL